MSTTHEPVRVQIHRAQRALVAALHALACDDPDRAYQAVCLADSQLAWVRGYLEPPEPAIDPESLRGTVAEPWIDVLKQQERPLHFLRYFHRDFDA